MFGTAGLNRDCCAKAATATSFLSALAHAGNHVTAATTCMALNDSGNDRNVRAKYLGYLMRSGCLRRLSVRDQYLTKDDVKNILDLYGKATRKECLEALYEPTWHGRKGSVLDDKNAKKVVPNGNEVLGVMHANDKKGDDIGDVFLAGFGQCGISKSLLPQVDAMAEAIAMLPTQDRSLKSLDLLFLDGAYTVQGILRIATTVGRPLDELKLEMEEGNFPLMSVFMVLEACRKLRRLWVKQIAITPKDDRLPFTPSGPRETPLEALVIDIASSRDDDDVSGLEGVCKVIGNFSEGLKELELLARNRYEGDRSVVPAFEELLSRRLPALRKLRIAGLNSMHLQSLWDRKRSTLHHVGVLMLECVPWDKDHWTQFLSALSDPTHPLARSVHTLHIALNGFEKTNELLAMLKKNAFLANVALDIPLGLRTSSKLIQDVQATNGKRVYGLKTPRHKAALLSVLKSRGVEMEPHLIRGIFDFTATTERRYVRMSLVSERREH